MMLRRAVPLFGFLLLGACDPDSEPERGSGGDSGQPDTGDTDDPTGDDTTGRPDTGGDTGGPDPVDRDAGGAIVDGHNAGSQLVAEGQGSAQVAAQAVEFASATVGTGALVTTGTVRQQGSGYVYEPTPADALVVIAEGETATFTIETMNGDLSSASNFLNDTHEFVYRVEADGRLDAELSSRRTGGNYTATILGELTVAGSVFGVDAEIAGSDFFEADSSGSHYRNDYRVTGTVVAPGYELQLDETWDFELITVSDGNDSAQSATRTLGNVLTLGADTYAWVDVLTHKSYRDGRPSQIDNEWACRGQILRNGQAFGEYRYDGQIIDSESGGFLLFMLDLPDGSHELERLPAY